MICNATADMICHVARHLGNDEICVRNMGRERAQRHCMITALTSPVSLCIIGVNGEPVSLIGADGDDGDDWAAVWMFSTPSAQREALTLVRSAREGVNFAKQFWPELRIEPEARPANRTRYLEMLGFTTRDDGVMTT